VLKWLRKVGDVMIEFILENLWTLWLGLSVLFLIAEALTAGLISIWFVPGAIISAVVSVFTDNFIVQLIVFLVSSSVFLILCKKFYKPDKATRLAEANELLIGKTGTAKSNINSIDGKVLIGDIYWKAVSDEEIEDGMPILVTGVNGTVVTVEKK